MRLTVASYLLTLCLVGDAASRSHVETSTVGEGKKSETWPGDLEPSSQIAFQPLFVYKQRKAEREDAQRRKTEAEAETTTPAARPLPHPDRIYYHLTPPSAHYYPYYPVYYQQLVKYYPYYSAAYPYYRYPYRSHSRTHYYPDITRT